MRAVVQRVKFSSVTYQSDERVVENSINKGLQILLGVAHEDNEDDLKYIVDKIIGLRIFEDENQKMNLSIKDIGGDILIISQFTLYGDARKGKRPSFTAAAKPEHAYTLYKKAFDMFKENGIECKTGKFGADMLVKIYNDGPVTILLDSQKNF